MKQILISFLWLISVTLIGQTEDETILFTDVSEDIVNPKNYIVTKTQEPLVIDGDSQEKSWASATYSDDFIDIEGIEVPQFKTRVKMLWDPHYLYVYAELNEPHIWADLKQRDTVIFYNNDFEVFLDPSGTTMGYGEIEINALNTVWDLYLDKPYRVGGKANFEWNLDDLKSAVKIHGTLNNHKDIDSMWTVEMAIPLKPLISLKDNPKGIPKEGEQWRINFSRVEWDYDVINNKYYRKREGNKFLKEHNWVWSNQKVINMHEPEKWGYLQFTEASTADEITFIKDEDVAIKQILFALFRKTNYGDLKYLTEVKHGTKKTLNVKYSETETIQATFYKTNFGFEYELKNTSTYHTYLINQEGLLIKKQKVSR